MTMETDRVYVLINSDYRTSRNFRAEWYFRHVHTNVTLHPLFELSSSGDGQPSDGSNSGPNSGELLSPVTSPTYSTPTAASTPGKSGSGLPPMDISDTPDSEFIIVSAVPSASSSGQQQQADQFSYHLGQNTEVLFLVRCYRLVFILDISASMFSMTDDGDLRLHKATKMLERTLIMLARKVRLPITDYLFTPNVKISIVAHSECDARVLLQGWTLKEDEIQSVMNDIRRAIDDIQNELIERYRGHGARLETSIHSSPRFRIPDGIPWAGSPPFPSALVNTGPRVSCNDLLSMIRHAMISVSFLDSDHASPGFILITDENLCMGDAQLLERTLQMLRADGIMCSFIKIGSAHKENLWEPSYTNFGQVDYRELCQFICKATVGTHFSISQAGTMDSGEDSYQYMRNECWYDLNAVQKAFFGWSFHKALPTLEMEAFDWSVPCKKSYVETTIKASVVSVLSIRLREGYILKECKFSRGTSTKTIQVELVLFWKPSVIIHYNISSLWPPELSQDTRVQVSVSANYDFLHEATCRKKCPDNSEYTARLMERFKNLFMSLKRTDYFLEHLHRFSTNSAFHTVPSQYQNGLMSVFEFQPGTNLSRATERNITDPSVAIFVDYWSKLKDIDMNTSHRWMHTQCVDLILEHDYPLPRHLSVPSSSGKFMNIQCKQAVQLVNQSLRNWATFTLIENHSYIKFVYLNDKASVPHSFYLIRLGQHSVSAVSLKFAFLAGTSCSDREKKIAELKEVLQSKMFPRRGKNADPKARHRSDIVANFRATLKGRKAHIPPLQRDLSETPCCTIIKRHLDRVIVNFDPCLLHPRSFQLRLENPPVQVGSSSNAMKAGGEKITSKLRLLSHHLHHRRHVWVTDHQPFYSSSSSTLMHMFYSLTMLRLQEGFHILQCKDGFLNMYLDIRLGEAANISGFEVNNCSVQYILYLNRVARRVHKQDSISSEQSVSLTEKAYSTPDEDTPIIVGDQIVSEVWIEPQVGTVTEPHPEIENWRHKSIDQIPNIVFELDRECIQTYFTLHQLREKAYLLYDVAKQYACMGFPGTVGNSPYSNNVKVEFMEPNLTNICIKSPSLTISLALFRGTENDIHTSDCLNVFISHLCEELCCGSRFVDITISDTEARNFTYEVMHANSSKSREQTMEVEHIIQSINHTSWRCFVKKCEDNPEHLTLMLIPSSTETLKEMNLYRADELTYLPVYVFVTSRLYMGYIIEDRWTYEKPAHQHIVINNDNDSLSKEFENSILENFDRAAKRTEKLTEEMEKLARHMVANTKQIIRLYSTTYLESVYLCLQKRFILHQRDLEYTFHYLCDDLPPLEIDITRYLVTVCGHCWRHKIQQEGRNKICLSELRNREACEQRENLHARIRLRVHSLVGKYFTRIPNCAHYFVYRAPKENTILGRPLLAAEVGASDNTNEVPDASSEPEAAAEVDEDNVLLAGLERRESFINEVDADDDDLDEELEVDQHLSAVKRKLFPFFFHIGCTVTYKEKVDNIVVDHIPTCLGDFLHLLVEESADDISGNNQDEAEKEVQDITSRQQKLNNGVDDSVEIDLNQLRITLDLYPLTMRDDGENDDSDDESLNEKNSSATPDSDMDDQPIVFQRPKQLEREAPAPAALDESFVEPPGYNQVSGIKSYNILPPAQRRTFDTCKEELEWILQDEIICCMKYEEEVQASNIEEIVAHVNCIMRQKERFIDVSSVLRCISLLPVRLRFVLSWEEGRKGFFDLLNRATIDENYQIIEIGEYFFLASLTPCTAQLPPWQTKDIPSWRNYNLEANDEPPLIVDGLPPGNDMNRLWKPSAMKAEKSPRQRRTSHSLPFVRPLMRSTDIVRSASLSELSSSALLTESRKTSLTAGGCGTTKTTSLELLANASESEFSRRALLRGEGVGQRGTPANATTRGTTIASSSVAMFPSRAASSYDGDFSSVEGPGDVNWTLGSEEDEIAEPDSPQNLAVPPFWLVLRLNERHLEVYFHHTDTHYENSFPDGGGDGCQFCSVRARLLEEIDKMIRLVNQRMLLNDLQETRRCNSLLVPASQDEVQWLGEDMGTRIGDQIEFGNESDDQDDMTWWYKNKMDPGHFNCPLIWREYFAIDPRIRMTIGGRAGRILSNLRTALEQFAVTNRKDMYVMTFNDPMYIILNELNREQRSDGAETPQIDLSASMDARSSIGHSINQIPDDAASICSFATTAEPQHAASHASHDTMAVNTLEMTVYGVSCLDKTTCQNLYNLIQSKLDNLLLEILCSCLMRNYNLRLYRHDIRFIQPAVWIGFSCMSLQLPPLVQELLAPFSYYLKQHLNHFLILPRYGSKSGRDHFQVPMGPVRDEKVSEDPDVDCPPGVGEAYVFNTYYGESIPTYGLACVVLQLVSGWSASPVEVVSTPLPAAFAGELLQHETDLRALVRVTEVDSSAPEGPSRRRRGPGPANYLRIFIWRRGEVDVDHLRGKLEAAVSGACEDVLMEYRFLTLPIADEGSQLRDLYSSSVDELLPPPSASATGNTAAMSSPLKRRQSIIDKFRWRSSSKSSREGVGTQDECSSPRPIPGATTESSSQPNTPSADDMQQFTELEAGDRGTLHPMYASQLLRWFELVGVDSLSDKSLGWRLYFKRKFRLKSDVSIVSFLELAVRCFYGAISKGNIFQRRILDDGSETWDVRHLGANPPSSGTSVLSLSSQPGSAHRFLLVGRNYPHWCRFMTSRGLLELARPVSQSEKVWHDVRSYQRLTGYDGEDELPNYCRIRTEDGVVIPRQLLCLLHVDGCEVSFYSYNFSKDTNTKIADQLASLVEWHNSRFSLFTSIVRQKLGLFQGMEETYSAFNPYDKAKHLIMLAAPPTPVAKPPPGQHSGHFSRFPSHGLHLGSTTSHSTAQDNKGLLPAQKSFVMTLHTSRWCGSLPAAHYAPHVAADIIQRYGHQVIQARKHDTEKDKDRSDMEEMARRWYLKMTTPTGIAFDRLTRMKAYCRLLHTVTSPLLLHPDICIMRRNSETSQGSSRSTHQLPQAMPSNRRKLSLVGEKKRHNSEGMCTALAQTSRRSPGQQKSTEGIAGEEEWVRRLKSHLLTQYELYLTRKLHFNEAIPRNRQDISSRHPYSLMYKSNFGGAIILVELLFRGPYFSVRVGAVEHQRLFWRLVRGNTTRETRLAFVDETDRLCHLTHLSSFVHDFHLRCIAHHIISEPLTTPWMTSSIDSTMDIRSSPVATLICNEEVTSLLRPRYHIISFLERILGSSDHRPPLYATNFLISWNYRVECNPACCVVGDKLFDYILNHEDIYNLRTLPMRSSDTLSVNEDFCLVDRENLAEISSDLAPIVREFYCYTVLTKENYCEQTAPDYGIGFRIFFIFVNAKQPFPNSSLERCRVSTKERRLIARRPCLLVPQAGVHEVNYLGWDARLQRPIVDFLPLQKERWRERLNHLVVHAAARAHKDHLWGRLFGALLNPSQPTGVTDMSTTSAAAASHDGGVQLQLSALREIMDMGTVLDLNQVDTRLAQTLNFNPAYHEPIMRHISQRFPTHSAIFRHQAGESSDLSAAVVLVHPNYRKAFLLLSQQTQRTSTLTLKAVFQEGDAETVPSSFYSSPLVDLVHAVAELCCFILWRKLHY